VPRIRVGVAIDASPRRVWMVLRDIASHVAWMDDAVAIRFTTRRRHGVGTAFECDTKVGPVRLVDRMEVTEWRPRRAMAVRHVGVVAGTGRFTIRRRLGRGSYFGWDEELALPWWLGGPLGRVVVPIVLRRVWRRNLRNLKDHVERRT
jgi:hypothetical protein